MGCWSSGAHRSMDTIIWWLALPFMGERILFWGLTKQLRAGRTRFRLNTNCKSIVSFGVATGGRTASEAAKDGVFG